MLSGCCAAGYFKEDYDSFIKKTKKSVTSNDSIRAVTAVSNLERSFTVMVLAIALISKRCAILSSLSFYLTIICLACLLSFSFCNFWR